MLPTPHQPTPTALWGDPLTWSIDPNFNFSSTAKAIGWGWRGGERGKVLKQYCYDFSLPRGRNDVASILASVKLNANIAINGSGSQESQQLATFVLTPVFLFLPEEKKKILISISLNWVGEHYQLEGPFWFDRPHCMMINYFSASLDFSNFLLPLAGGTAR